MLLAEAVEAAVVEMKEGASGILMFASSDCAQITLDIVNNVSTLSDALLDGQYRRADEMAPSEHIAHCQSHKTRGTSCFQVCGLYPL